MNILELFLFLIAVSIPSAGFWVTGVIYLCVGYNHKGPHPATLVKEYVTACQDKYGHKYKCDSPPYHISQDFVYLKDPANINSSHVCTIGRDFGYRTRNDANNHVNNINKEIANGVIYTRTVYGSAGDDKFCLDQKLINYYKQVGWGCLAPVFLLYAFFILLFFLDFGSSDSETTCCKKMCGWLRDCCSTITRCFTPFCNRVETQDMDHRHQYEPNSSIVEPTAIPATPRTAARATFATASRFFHSQLPTSDDDIELANVTPVIDNSTSFKAKDTVAVPVDMSSVNV
jgi:TM2 domain-containing membrane protein YozV